MTEQMLRSRVQSVGRAAQLLEILGSADPSGRSLGQVAEELGVARSTAHTLLRTLEACGFVSEVAGPRFLLGPALIRLGDVAARQLPLADIARPVLAALSAETGLTARFAVPDNGYPVYVATVDGPGSVTFRTPLGTRETAHTSAAGKLFLADLPEEQVHQLIAETGLPPRTRRTITDMPSLLEELRRVKDRGFAVDDEEDVEGIMCVSVGVRDRSGRLRGALSVTGINVQNPTLSTEDLAKIIGKHASDFATRIGG